MEIIAFNWEGFLEQGSFWVRYVSKVRNKSGREGGSARSGEGLQAVADGHAFLNEKWDPWCPQLRFGNSLLL